MCATKYDSIPSDSGRQVSEHWYMAETYKIQQLDDGRWLLVRDDGLPIGPTERDILVEAARNAWRDGGDNAVAIEAERIASEAQWHFPRKRSDLFGIGGGCVYFITDDTRPGLVKIGYTINNVLPRAKQLRIQENCFDPQVIACAVTHLYRRMELGLHGMFNKYRKQGEWFEEAPVLDYIQRFNSGGAA